MIAKGICSPLSLSPMAREVLRCCFHPSCWPTWCSLGNAAGGSWHRCSQELNAKDKDCLFTRWFLRMFSCVSFTVPFQLPSSGQSSPDGSSHSEDFFSFLTGPFFSSSHGSVLPSSPFPSMDNFGFIWSFCPSLWYLAQRSQQRLLFVFM